MKFSLIGDVVKNWVDATIDELCELLHVMDIPFSLSWTRDDGRVNNPYRMYTRQIVFPWDVGDVVVGTLHIHDDDVMMGHIQLTYPSIETYNFPWDEGDITVFDRPSHFVDKLRKLYNEKLYNDIQKEDGDNE